MNDKQALLIVGGVVAFIVAAVLCNRLDPPWFIPVGVGSLGMNLATVLWRRWQ